MSSSITSMLIYAAAFGVSSVRVLGAHTHIDGPASVLDAVKARRRSCDLRCKLKRDLQDRTILLKSRPGQNPKHVRNLLEQWTE